MVDIVTPTHMSGEALDFYLENGWFRSTNALFRSKFICIDEKISSIINVRLKVFDFEFKKRHRRILNRVENKFKIIIKKASLTPEKEILYRKFKDKFKGFVLFSLYNLLYDDPSSPVYNSFEIDVYDGEELIAFSFFDIGKNSVASLIAIYDPKYSEYSLGSYTMLKEIEFCKNSSIIYYYPGYILDNNDIFDYKFRTTSIESTQFLQDELIWKDFFLPKPILKSTTIIYQKIKEIKDALVNSNLQYRFYLNPFFSLGYSNTFGDRFLKCPFVYFIFTKKELLNKIAIEYFFESDQFGLSIVYRHYGYDFLKRLQDGSYFEKSSMYLTDIYVYYVDVLKSETILPVISKVFQLVKNDDFYII